MAVAQQLHGGGQVNGFINDPRTARGGVTGRQKRRLARSTIMLLDQISDGQRLIDEPEPAFDGIGEVLSAMTRQVHPGVVR